MVVTVPCGEEPVDRGGGAGGQCPVVLPVDGAGENFVVSSLTGPALAGPALAGPALGGAECLELPRRLRAGGRGGQGVAGQLQVLSWQGLVVQLEEAGDEAGPGWPGLGLVHPAALDDVPQLPGTVDRPRHPVAVLDELQESLQCGNIPVRSVSPGDDLPQ